ncbi:MAG: hypothetical protein H0W62_03170 [Chitinophagales bacterium]|nr:hypothetical protein [Chitinophagales bacterium]
MKCINTATEKQLEMLKDTRSFGEYELKHEWSDRLTSTQTFRKKLELTGGIEYVFFLVTDPNVDATAIEIKDALGDQLDYEYNVSGLEKNIINFFFTADFDGSYYLLFRVINKQQPSTCTYMGVLEGESDMEDF